MKISNLRVNSTQSDLYLTYPCKKKEKKKDQMMNQEVGGSRYMYMYFLGQEGGNY